MPVLTFPAAYSYEDHVLRVGIVELPLPDLAAVDGAPVVIRTRLDGIPVIETRLSGGHLWEPVTDARTGPVRLDQLAPSTETMTRKASAWRFSRIRNPFRSIQEQYNVIWGVNDQEDVVMFDLKPMSEDLLASPLWQGIQREAGKAAVHDGVLHLKSPGPVVDLSSSIRRPRQARIIAGHRSLYGGVATFGIRQLDELRHFAGDGLAFNGGEHFEAAEGFRLEDLPSDFDSLPSGVTGISRACLDYAEKRKVGDVRKGMLAAVRDFRVHLEYLDASEKEGIVPDLGTIRETAGYFARVLDGMQNNTHFSAYLRLIRSRLGFREALAPRPADEADDADILAAAFR